VADSAIDEEHGNDKNGGGFENGNDDEDRGDEDDSSADLLTHTQVDAQAPSSPFNTVANSGSITNPFVRTGRSLLDPSDEDNDKQAPHSRRIQFCIDSNGDDDVESENLDDSAAMQFGMSEGTVVLGTQLALYNRISATSHCEATASDRASRCAAAAA
jgi:hypothetical protein